MARNFFITGGAGFIGSNYAHRLMRRGEKVTIYDNLSRAGAPKNIAWLEETFGKDAFKLIVGDLRDDKLLTESARGADVIVHLGGQVAVTTSVTNPREDFEANALGTFNALEAARLSGRNPIFIYSSTNKVYGDAPNRLPLVERASRWEIDPAHPYAQGIPESMSIDCSLHSLFGASKAAADLLVQEYGRYFGMKTVCFRGGCLTGPNHSGTQLHGFLANLMQCTVTGARYTVFGYKGKQVRDNLHSADLARAFEAFYRAPRAAAVYNIGGGRTSNCSMLEAIEICEQLVGRPLAYQYQDLARIGDHIWYISDVRRFQSHYPNWKYRYGLREILREIHDACAAKS